MSTEDCNSIKIKQAVAPVVISDNTVTTSNIIDRQGFDALTFAVSVGSAGTSSGAFAVTGTQGNAANLSDGVPIAAADVIGTLAAAGWTGSGGASPGLNSIRKLGYNPVNIYRYVQIVITPTGNSAACNYSAVAILSRAKNLPQAAQTS